MKTIPDEIMQERRNERLKRLTFFMRDERVPMNARRVLSRSECLNLLTGFFSNSHWRTAAWVIREALDASWMNVGTTLWFFWHRTIRRRTGKQLEELILKLDELILK